MHKIEKRLIIAALLFVMIYIGAIVLTIHSRTSPGPAEIRIESAELDVATRHVILAEVLPPILVLLTLAICFVILKKKEQRARERMDAFEKENPPADPVA